MKVLVFVKATPNSEKGIKPNDEQLSQMFEAMGKYNDQLVKAGIMKDADGLKPSVHGKRIKFSGTEAATVIDGPFAETKELVAGYWIWDVESMDEAVAWGKKCPNPMPGEEGVIEIRPAYSADDFKEFLTDDQGELDSRLRKEFDRQLKAKVKPAKKGKAAPAKKKPASRKKVRRPARAKSKK